MSFGRMGRGGGFGKFGAGSGRGTPDTTAPTLSVPLGTKTGQTTASLGVTTDEGNGILYLVVTTSNTSPTAAQIIAGQDNSSVAAAYAANQAVSATGAQTVSGATGLASGTTYTAHYVQKDAALNASNIVKSSTFATDSAYTGPGDLTNFGTALGWWGLRAFKAAKIGSACVNISRSSDGFVATHDVLIAANGHLDTTDAFFNGSTYRINTLYDQSGAGLDFVPHGTTTAIPNLVLAVIGGTYPVMRFAVANGQIFDNTTGVTASQPFFASWVGSHTGASSGLQDVIASNGASIRIGYGSANNTALISAGTNLNATASVDTFHAIQTNFNTAGTSDLTVDNTRTTFASPGPSTNGMSGKMQMGGNTFNSAELDADIAEFGVWSGLIASADETAMNSNQHGANGYNF